MSALSFLRGAHYRSEMFYHFLTLLTLGKDCGLRYRIAAEYVNPGESLWDVCAGTGRLKNFLPEGCSYMALESSPEFLSVLGKRGINHIVWNFHKGWPENIPPADVVIMLISLYQFRKTSVDHLLESFKTAARRVVIVEDVLPRPGGEKSPVQRLMNYLCAAECYLPVTRFARAEFEQLMRRHGYRWERTSGRYMVGLYGV